MPAGAYEENVQAVSLNAAVDLSETGINRFVKVVDSVDGDISLCGAGERGAGVLLTKTVQGQPGRVGWGGIVPLLLGGTVSKGGEIASGANGVGVAQAGGAATRAIALSDGVQDDIIPVLLQAQR